MAMFRGPGEPAFGGVLVATALVACASCSLVNDLDECLIPGECGPPAPEEDEAACANGQDDDLDGYTDCRDLGCAGTEICREVSPATCDDGVDNDLDGLADCADTTCCPFAECWAQCPYHALPRANRADAFSLGENFEADIRAEVWGVFGDPGPGIEPSSAGGGFRAVGLGGGPDEVAQLRGLLSNARPVMFGDGIRVSFDVADEVCLADTYEYHELLVGLVLSPRGEIYGGTRFDSLATFGLSWWGVGWDAQASLTVKGVYRQYYLRFGESFSLHVDLVAGRGEGDAPYVSLLLDGWPAGTSVAPLDEVNGPLAVLVAGDSSCSGPRVDNLIVSSPAGIPFSTGIDNPVFEPAADPDAWDGMSVGSPVVRRGDDGYEMLYLGWNGWSDTSGLGRATSPDGVEWVRAPAADGGPIVEYDSGAPADATHFDAPALARDDARGLWRLWYVLPWETGAIHEATSADGVTWDYLGATNLDVWSATAEPQIMFYGLSAVPDGEAWVLFYGAKALESGASQIWRVRSTDAEGLVFDLADRRVVLAPGAPGRWDAAGVLYPKVVRTADGAFVMMYVGLDFPANGVGLAVSHDGVTWEKRTDGPIVRPLGYGFDAGPFVLGPELLVEGTRLRIWYSAPHSNRESLGLAEVDFDPAFDDDEGAP
jgi:hypothetical protein